MNILVLEHELVPLLWSTKAQINGLLSLKLKYRLNTRGHSSNVTQVYVSEITLQTRYTFLYCQFHKVNSLASGKTLQIYQKFGMDINIQS